MEAIGHEAETALTKKTHHHKIRQTTLPWVQTADSISRQ
jgi:hypothetical protein